MRNSRLQRLARHEEKATIKKTVYLFVFSLVILVLFFFVGIPFLGKFADFFGTVFHGKTAVEETPAPQPPTLDDLPSATNSARLKVSGFSNEGKSVEIYLNDGKVKTVDISDSHFEYGDVNLKEGQNTISAKAVNDTGKTSASSKTVTIIYTTHEPKLEIETPTEGQSFSGSNRIKVSGKTDTDSQVYANGFLANINADGKFEVLVPVSEGETTIEIKAVDQAGNSKVEKRKVNFKK